MKSPTTDSRRLIRASIIGGCSAILSSLGHILGSIGQPAHELNLWSVPIVAVGITILAMIMAESEFTLGRLVGFIATTQVLTHVALTLGTGGGHQGAHGHAGPQLDAVTTTALASSPNYGQALLMIAGHLVAGAGVTWLLYQGESLMFRMYRQVPGFVQVLCGYGLPKLGVSLVAAPQPAAIVSQESATNSNTKFRLLAADPWRGPPAACA